MIGEDRVHTHFDSKNRSQFLQPIIATAFADFILAIAQRRSVASTASDALPPHHKERPAEHNEKCSGNKE